MAREFRVGGFERYPDLTGARQAEGGRRLAGDLAESRPEAPLVSILTVAFDAAATIEQTIRSVGDQTHGNIEHLVIDGGSTDGTLEVLRRYEDQLAYYVSEPDRGLYFAMNKGLELARGDYVLILNADDWYEPDAVEVLLAARAESGADFVSALATYTDQAGALARLQPSFPFDAGIYFRMPLRHETMLLSRALYRRHGPYDTRYRVNADRALTTRLFEAGLSHHEVQRPVMFFRDTGVSSTDMPKLHRERERMVSRTFPGLPAPDVALLAQLDQLQPARLVTMAWRYRRRRFALAALAYGTHRAARTKRGNWAGFDFSDLRHLAEALPPDPEPLTIATLSTADHGGAGIGSMRRIEALRKAGQNAELYCLFRKSGQAHVDELALAIPEARHLTEPEIRTIWRARAVVGPRDAPRMTAKEMFSKAGGIVDFRDNGVVFDHADIVHLHWVVGLFDHDHGDALAHRPVVWTLADMNAFTGGCHYSEGCEGYRRDCRVCPLLGGGSSLAHENWKRKRAAYARIPDLHVICPSDWLAERVRASSLLGDRPVHMIPNALPVDRFRPTNRLAARARLGLPLDRKLIAFGADNLGNHRKGGDILVAAVQRLQEKGAATGVEGLFFGSNALDLGLPAHQMGHVNDEEKLSLVYAAADAFAFPSREDNAPLTAVEALLSGTPVVGFPVGNVPELVRHRITGYVAAYEDIDDFAEGLAWALADTGSPDTTLRRLRCHLDARTHNDPETSAARHVALYRSLLKTDAGARRAPDGASFGSTQLAQAVP